MVFSINLINFQLSFFLNVQLFAFIYAFLSYL